MTRGLDTSVILRLVTNRPQPMASEVADYIRALLAAGDTFAVSDLVVSEAYFALQHHYDLTKEQAIESLRLLSRETGFCFADISRVALETPGAHRMSPGLVDRMISGEYRQEGIRTLSCEKDFKKLPETDVIP